MPAPVWGAGRAPPSEGEGGAAVGVVLAAGPYMGGRPRPPRSAGGGSSLAGAWRCRWACSLHRDCSLLVVEGCLKGVGEVEGIGAVTVMRCGRRSHASCGGILNFFDMDMVVTSCDVLVLYRDVL